MDAYLLKFNLPKLMNSSSELSIDAVPHLTNLAVRDEAGLAVMDVRGVRKALSILPPGPDEDGLTTPDKGRPLFDIGLKVKQPRISSIFWLIDLNLTIEDNKKGKGPLIK